MPKKGEGAEAKQRKWAGARVRRRGGFRVRGGFD